MLRTGLALVMALAVAGSASAQQVIFQGPPGDGPMLPGMGRQFKTGTARVSGRVVSVDSGAPLRRAQVRIAGPDIMPKTAMTDNEGRYSFSELPAGRFTITATKSGFVTVTYGQTRPFEAPKPVDISDAQVLDKADIHMPRGSVIAGRILDEFGEPVPDVTVNALRSTWSAGRRRLTTVGRMAQTNDLGQYRLYGLPPGEYYITASLRGAEMAAMEMAMMAVRAGGGGATGNDGASAPRTGYATTYFPGTPSGAEAQRVRLDVGQEASNTDFALAAVRLAKVSGTVMSSDGKPAASVTVNLVPKSEAVGGISFPMSARTDRNGNFTINGVTPGEYTLQTTAVQTITSTSDGGTNVRVFSMRVEGGPGGGGGGGEPEVGSIPLSVSGDDVNNVIVLTAKGAVAKGTVSFEGGAKPTNLGGMRVIASATDGDTVIMAGSGGTGSVGPDGAFEVRGLVGQRVFRIVNIPSGWTLKSIRHSGNDVTDTGVDFKPGAEVPGIDIVLTNRTTEVTGTVQGGDGKPVTDYTVVIFSQEPQKWTIPQSRYVTGTRADTQGKFQVKNLPPGSYYAVAVEYIPQGEWGDPDMLDRLKALATSFSLDDGENKSLSLKLTSM